MINDDKATSPSTELKDQIEELNESIDSKQQNHVPQLLQSWGMLIMVKHYYLIKFDHPMLSNQNLVESPAYWCLPNTIRQ